MVNKYQAKNFSRVSDPYSFNTDTDPDPIQIQGFFNQEF
jgi:hypothetical protein